MHSDFLIQKAKKKQEQKLKREQAKQVKIQQGIDDFNSLQNPLPNLNPNDLYNVIYADPSTINKTLEELKKYIIPSSENSVLFIWSPVKNLPATLDLMNTWGFNYKEHLFI